MTQKLALFSMTVALIAVAGCARAPRVPPDPIRYDGPGSFEDFARARYECFDQTKGTSSSGYLNQYGGAASSAERPDCGNFNACLAARGYIRNPNGRLDASSIQIRCNR